MNDNDDATAEEQGALEAARFDKHIRDAFARRLASFGVQPDDDSPEAIEVRTTVLGGLMGAVWRIVWSQRPAGMTEEAATEHVAGMALNAFRHLATRGEPADPPEEESHPLDDDELDAFEAAAVACDEGGAVAVPGPVLLGLCGLARAGSCELEKMALAATRLDVKPGDLVLCRVAAETEAEMDVVRSALESLAHSLRVRVVAVPPDSSFETVDGAALATVARMIADVVSMLPAGTSGETIARVFVELLAGEGLVVMRPAGKVTAPAGATLQ